MCARAVQLSFGSGEPGVSVAIVGQTRGLSMSGRVAARIGAARLVLEQVRGQPAHEHISRLQCAALCELFEQVAPSAEERAELASKIIGFHWAGDHGVRVLSALTPTEEPGPKKRRSQQNFDAMVSYGTQEFWDHLGDSAAVSNSKLDSIISMGIRLGLRCPSEHTLKLMNSLWVFCSEPNDRLQRMSSAQKYTLLQHTKREFDRARKLACEPPLYIQKLPEESFLVHVLVCF